MINLKEFFGLSHYISALDQFLAHFDRENAALSKSQRQEKKKYQRIFQLRNNLNPPAPKEKFWESF